MFVDVKVACFALSILLNAILVDERLTLNIKMLGH